MVTTGTTKAVSRVSLNDYMVLESAHPYRVEIVQPPSRTLQLVPVDGGRVQFPGRGAPVVEHPDVVSLQIVFIGLLSRQEILAGDAGRHMPVGIENQVRHVLMESRGLSGRVCR